MIVECERCSTKYRVREDKFPKGGGNIKCPECGHVFYIKPPDEDAPPGLAPMGLRRTTTPSSSDEQATRVGNLPSDLLGGSGVHARIQKPQAPEPQAAPESPAPNGPPVVDLSTASWKLKTSFGLIYDFPDTTSLKNWLSGRDELGGYQLSHDGQTFKALDAYPQIATGLGRAGRSGDGMMGAPGPSGPLRGSGPLDPSIRPDGPAKGAPTKGAPTKGEPAKGAPARATGQIKAPVTTPPARGTTGPIKNAPPRRREEPEAEEEDEKAGNPNLWIGVAVVGTVALLTLVGLQAGGVIDVKKMMPQPAALTKKAEPQLSVRKSANTDPAADPYARRPAQPQQKTPQPKVDPGQIAPVAPSPFGHGDHVADLLSQARKDIGRRKYEEALDSLISAKGIAPNNPEVYKMLETVYSRKGQRELAKDARETSRRLSLQQRALPEQGNP